MPEPSLRAHDFRLSYGPGDDRLNAFYIPALQASVAYDRMTGYFSSHALAIAAAGVAHLIANGGRMRLLVGAQLSAEDVQAIEAGYDLPALIAARFADVLPDPDALAVHLRDRLAALAWMVAHHTLDIRVVLPTDAAGRPLPAPDTRDYFHPKVGLFTDAAGDQVVFSGSINESETGWEHNYEQFMVFTSWAEGRAWVAEGVARFARLWEHREPGWLSLPIPEAARQNLLRYVPAHAPTRDPLEPVEPVFPTSPARPESLSHTQEAGQPLTTPTDLARERILCQFLRDAPYLVGTTGLGAATCGVAPWPHQLTVARQVVETYPARYLFADEVGLGKTIEAGLVLRELWLRGVVRRALILAPKSVLRQWQEELAEKFALDVPVYDGRLFRDYAGVEIAPGAGNPWDGVTLALASSQLVKRSDRQADLLAARPWDLILVDEAHHARRKDFLDQNAYRPNRLLELLNALHTRTAGLLLMTATPMQVDPIEVWDLLALLGLSGEWGADGRDFLKFYTQLRQDEPDWDFLLQMTRAELRTRDGALDAKAVARAKSALGVVAWAQVESLLLAETSPAAVKPLSPAAQRVLTDLVKQHTPLQRLVFRNTRPLLRDYVRRGLLTENVAQRAPQLVWIPLRADEHDLYDRIEDYIGNFYRKYEAKRTGLGFVMTVYRRRLTSSFYAVRRSLERRLAFLQGKTGLSFGEDDLEQDALALDMDEVVESSTGSDADYRQEIAYVEDFLHQLKALGHDDSKVERLLADVADAFRARDTVLIFTQYTDTLDFLRERLRESYGTHVACYSGRGGEWWDGNAWVPLGKEDLKNDFREGQRIKILLATDAASEGLNLQTCGVLINYDMPWNPMRVEQRIGRVDRIGQRYAEVWVYNYFYTDTVEAKVYKALENRIHWFQDVVGPLQPILAQVERAIHKAAMTRGAARDSALAEDLQSITDTLNAQDAGLNLDAWAGQAQEVVAWPAPVTLPEMAKMLLESPSLAPYFHPHETLPDAYRLVTETPAPAVTFDRALADAHPDTLRLLTYNIPVLQRLLSKVPAPEQDDTSAVRRVTVDTPLSRVAYYSLTPAGQLKRLDTLAALREALARDPAIPWDAARIAEAQADAQSAVQREADRLQTGQERLHQARVAAWVARARRLLLDAALVELALGQQPGLLAQESYPAAFNSAAVSGLRRHKYPWAALLKRVAQVGDAFQPLTPTPTDPYFTAIQGEPPERLKRRFEVLTRRAENLVREGI